MEGQAAPGRYCLQTALRGPSRCANLALERSLPGARSSVRPEQAVRAGVAQLVEHLICNQRVGGSSPFASSSLSRTQGSSKICKDAPATRSATPTPLSPISPRLPGLYGEALSGWGSYVRVEARARSWNRAQVAERLMAADCKSARPSDVRRFESSPVHQKLAA